MKSQPLTIIGLILLAGAIAHGQAVLETSFEKGKDAPDGWKLGDTYGQWEHAGRTGARSIGIVGDGKRSSGWVFQPPPLEPNRTYRFSVWYKSESTGDNTHGVLVIVAGSMEKIYTHSPDWTQAEFVFSTPDSLEGKQIRLGQWHFNGKIWYDDCRIEPVNLTFFEQDGLALDQHERIEKKTYVFEPDFLTLFTNCFRVDHGNTVQFHHDKWWLHTDQYLTHKYCVGKYKQLSADLSLRITYEDPNIADNQVTVEAGADNKTWTELGKYSDVGEYKMTLPANLFPAEQIFVRMRGRGSMQVRTYRYAAKLDGSPPDLKGRTEAFRGDYVVVDNGSLRLKFEQGDRRLVSIAQEGKPVGSLECMIAQFERKGIGYKGTGVGVANATDVKGVEVKVNEPKRCVFHVTVERRESVEMGRRFEATYEFTVYAGQSWYESRLLSVTNTDDKEYEFRGYFHLLQPADPSGSKPFCFPTEAAWVGGGAILGAAIRQEDDLTLGLRLAGIAAHGDITRRAEVMLPPAKTWTGKEPTVMIFVGQGSAAEDVVRQAREVLRISASPDQHAQGTIVLKEQKHDAAQPQK